MGDFARILNEKAPVSDYLLLMFVVALFGVGVIALRGFQTAKLNLLVSGLVLIPLATLADILTRGRIFRSPSSWSMLAFSVALPIAVVELSGLVSKLKFSFYRQSSQTIFSTILSSTSKNNQIVFNLFFAPVIETFAGLAIGIISYKAFFMPGFQFIGLPRNIASIPSSILAAVPGALLLTRIHTTAGVEFQVVAFVFFYLMMSPVFIEDLLNASIWVKPLRVWVPITMGLGLGIHFAINGSQIGGFLTIMNSLWQDTSQISWLYQMVVLWFGVTFLSAGHYAWSKSVGRVVSIRGLIASLL